MKRRERALLLIDLQNDFMPGGALAVPEGDAILPIVNDLMSQFETVVATVDWHPQKHCSFAANHLNARAFEEIDCNGIQQMLWPIHCVQHTGGAFFAPTLNTRAVTRVFTKGSDADVDSYSAFFDNGRQKSTGLDLWLRDNGITHLTVAGVATDFCVKYSVLDALKLGFAVDVVTRACRGVNVRPGDADRALKEMLDAGANLIS